MTTRTFIRILLVSYFISLLSIGSYGQCTSVTTLGGLTSGSKFKFSVKETGHPIRVRTDNKLEESTTDNNNVFQLVDVGSGYFKIVNDANGYVLEIDGGSQSAGAFLVQTSTYSGADQQKFKFELVGSSFKMIPKHTEGFTYGVVMEMYTGSGEYGLIRQYGYGSPVDNAQLFDICKIGCTPPSAPTSVTATPSNIFVSGTSSLSATCSSGTVRWYDVSTGGTTVGTGSPWTTPTLTTTKTYYAACFSSCESSRTSVTVTVCPTAAPTAVSASPSTRTSSGTSSLSATCSSGTVRWYDVASGGTTVGTGSPWVTPTLTATKTYYAACFNTCESARVSVTVCITPAAPIGVTATPSIITSGGTSSLTATCNGGTVRWYDVSTGGSTVGTGSPWTTPALTATKTYYAACFSTCESATRNSVTVNVCPAAPTSVIASPSSVSSGGISSLSATCGSGTVRWYNVADGGSIIGTGSPLATDSLFATKTYYAACYNTCESARVSVVMTVNNTTACTAVTTVGGLTSGSKFKFKVKLTGNTIRVRTDNKLEESTTDNNNVFQLVDVGGGYFKIVNDANSYILEVQSGSQSQGAFLIQTATYSGADQQKFKFTLVGTSFKMIPKHTEGFSYGISMETYNGSGEYGLIRQYGYGSPVEDFQLFDICKTGCTPPSAPTSVTATPSYISASGTSSLSATCSSGTVRWYDVSTGGTTVGTGSPWTTPTLTTTKTYYAACFNACESARVSVVVTLNNCSAVTTVGGLTSGSKFKFKVKLTGNPIRVRTDSKLEESTTDNSNVFQLVDVGGGYFKIVNDANSYVLEVQSGSQSQGAFLVQTATYSGTDQQKFKFTLVGTSFKMIPKHTESFSYGIAMETYTGSGEYGLIRQYGYGSPVEDSQLFDICNTGCTPPSAPTSVTATSSNIPVGGTSSLSATCSSGTVRWYDVSTGGTTVGTGSPWTTPTLTTTKTYYAACFSSCESSRTSVTVTVCSTAAPTGVSASPSSRTSSGTSSLSASCSSGTVRWYDVANGGTTVGTGSPWTTPTLTTTKTYYAACFNTCEGARVSVTVCISPAAPTGVTAIPSVRTSSGTSSLSATCSSGTLRWYDVATGGTTVGTGSPWTTPTITATKTYYAACFNTCESARTSVTVTICTTPTPTSVSASPDTRTTPGTSSLSATCSSGTIRWYDVAGAGTVVGTGSPWTTPTLTQTTTYYAACYNTCESARVSVTVMFDIVVPGEMTIVSQFATGLTGDASYQIDNGGSNWYYYPSGEYYSNLSIVPTSNNHVQVSLDVRGFGNGGGTVKYKVENSTGWLTKSELEAIDFSNMKGKDVSIIGAMFAGSTIEESKQSVIHFQGDGTSKVPSFYKRGTSNRLPQLPYVFPEFGTLTGKLNILGFGQLNESFEIQNDKYLSRGFNIVDWKHNASIPIANRIGASYDEWAYDHGCPRIDGPAATQWIVNTPIQDLYNWFQPVISGASGHQAFFLDFEAWTYYVQDNQIAADKMASLFRAFKQANPNTMLMSYVGTRGFHSSTLDPITATEKNAENAKYNQSVSEVARQFESKAVNYINVSTGAYDGQSGYLSEYFDVINAGDYQHFISHSWFYATIQEMELAKKLRPTKKVLPLLWSYVETVPGSDFTSIRRYYKKSNNQVFFSDYKLAVPFSHLYNVTAWGNFIGDGIWYWHDPYNAVEGFDYTGGAAKDPATATFLPNNFSTNSGMFEVSTTIGYDYAALALYELSFNTDIIQGSQPIQMPEFSINGGSSYYTGDDLKPASGDFLKIPIVRLKKHPSLNEWLILAVNRYNDMQNNQTIRIKIPGTGQTVDIVLNGQFTSIRRVKLEP